MGVLLGSFPLKYCEFGSIGLCLSSELKVFFLTVIVTHYFLVFESLLGIVKETVF